MREAVAYVSILLVALLACSYPDRSWQQPIGGAGGSSGRAGYGGTPPWQGGSGGGLWITVGDGGADADDATDGEAGDAPAD